jgi:heme/copper-type cytochrome/quinol oxidase subunit 3
MRVVAEPAASSSPFKEGHHTPRPAGTLGMILFLAALGMLFAWSLGGYVIIRVWNREKFALGMVRLPWTLWVSTALMLASSVALHLGLRAVRREKSSDMLRWLWAAMALAVAFVLVQTPAMAAILAERSQSLNRQVATHHLLFFLVLLHALHVVGGLVALGRVISGARRRRFDHESHEPIKYAVMYWHFLDVVWLVMFAVLLLTR